MVRRPHPILSPSPPPSGRPASSAASSAGTPRRRSTDSATASIVVVVPKKQSTGTITRTLFAVEIILLDIELSHITNIVIASVVGSVVSRVFLGDFPTFVTVVFDLRHYWELGVYLALGLAGGIVAIFFNRLAGLTEDLFMRIRVPDWLKPGIGGLLLGFVALAGFGRAVAEVGAVIIVGGNINHVTRVMTTTIALETSKGNLELALALGVVLLAIALFVNAAVMAVRASAVRAAYA